MGLEISALMSTADEEEWARDGIFHIIDELSNKLEGGRNLSEPTILETILHLPSLVDHSWEHESSFSDPSKTTPLPASIFGVCPRGTLGRPLLVLTQTQDPTLPQPPLRCSPLLSLLPKEP
jgi:hypothetical protein